ncbi:hypothetical protein G7046_g8680 [Stylonectria norvegica]|nr:hypothetical protein G7046_g8680 [Stylonectria norvegica]
MSPNSGFRLFQQLTLKDSSLRTNYGGMAQRGPGLMMLEATAVQPNGRITPEDSGIWLDAHVDSLKKHVDFAHSQNVLIGIQLGHAGRKASTVAPWLGWGVTATEEVGGWSSDLMGPSELPFGEHYPTPRAMTLTQIAQVKQDFFLGVRRAIRAGFDIIELHFAHGYLVASFLSPVGNKRTDSYGGNFENRTRIAIELVDAVRSAMPERMPRFVRISATDWLDSNPDWKEPSWTIDDSVRLAKMLAQRGVDVLDVSSGGSYEKQKVVSNPGYQATFSKKIKAAVGDSMLVSAVGSINTGHLAQKLIVGEEGEDDVPLDLIAAGRMFQKNPGLVWAWADDLGVTINVAHQIKWGDLGDSPIPSHRSYMGYGPAEPRLFEFSDRGRTLAARLVEISKKEPDDFLHYLQQAWKRDKIYAKENPDSISDIKALRVFCEDGKFRAIGSSYIPLPKLVYLRSRYMLEGEPFPFLKLDPALKPEGGFGPWRCLRAFARYHDDLDFFLEMLIRIRRSNAPTVDFPRRILELYLRMQAECEGSKDLKGCQQKVRDIFEKEQLIYVHPIWRPPSECVIDDLCETSSTLSKSALFPVPRDWDASKSELVSLREFHTQTLLVQNATYQTILDVLEKHDFDASLAPSDLWLTNDLYRGLDKLRMQLSPEDSARLRTTFTEKAIVAVARGDNVIWLYSSDCTWNPKLDSPEVNDLSEHYPELKTFFTNFLDVKQDDAGLIFDRLMSVASLSSGRSRDGTAKGLLVALSQKIPIYGHIFDKEKFARTPIFPIATPDGDVLLCASTMEFSIADRKYLREAFSGKLNLLDFDPDTVWMLDNLLVWAGLDTRYLSRNVEEKGPYEEDFKSVELAAEISRKASQLLRIAVHFRSPRTTSLRGMSWLQEVLEHAQLRLVSGLPSKLVYCAGNAEIIANNPLGGLDIKDAVGLMIFVDDENWELLKQTVLPRRLLKWMMTDPNTQVTEGVTDRAVGLTWIILNVPSGREHTIPKILDAEGVVDLEILTESPYWQVNSESGPESNPSGTEQSPPTKTLDEPSLTPDSTEDLATEPGLRLRERGLERRDSEKQNWEPEFIANEATLLDFSDWNIDFMLSRADTRMDAALAHLEASTRQQRCEEAKLS